MGDVSPHFSRWEFACHHCGQVVINGELVTLLERIRAIVRKPIPVISGYRCPTHNRAVGGARRSMHLQGRAADLPMGLVGVAAAIEADARGIGVCRGYAVHVDVRRTAQRVIFDDC